MAQGHPVTAPDPRVGEIQAEAVEAARVELAGLLADSIYRFTGVSTSSSKEIADELIAAGYARGSHAIPSEATKAAVRAAKALFGGKPPRGTRAAVHAALEAAAPHMHAHLLAELRDRDEKLAKVEEAAREWDEIGKGNEQFAALRVSAYKARAAVAAVRGEE